MKEDYECKRTIDVFGFYLCQYLYPLTQSERENTFSGTKHTIL